jgi:hypothetical protein
LVSSCQLLFFAFVPDVRVASLKIRQPILAGAGSTPFEQNKKMMPFNATFNV